MSVAREEEIALSIRSVTVRFGGLLALSNFDLEVPEGARYGIIGPNGSGKTTLYNVITGLIPPSAGRVIIHGIEVTKLPPHRRVHLGLARTFQITNLFPQLTVLENVLLGALVRVNRHRDFWQPCRQDKEACAVSEALLAQFGLAHLTHRRVADIGYGERRQLEIALALTTSPRLLLLDEPTAGLSAAETAMVCDVIAKLPGNLTVVLIEHDLGVVFDLTDQMAVLYYGERIADGPSQVVRNDPRVKEVYLGGI
ncbi:MAG: ABC transporter ATP-binding protein [Chloroflexota bacterium]